MMLLMATFLLRIQAQIPYFTENFDESSLPTGWTIVDADGDNFNWQSSITLMGSNYGHNSSAGCFCSQSYDHDYGVLYPDNWLITPAIELGTGSTLSYWICAQDASYAAEHYGVYISTSYTGNPDDFNADDFTLLYQETIGQGTRVQSPWVEHLISLSEYGDSTVYIAFRHFNCHDMFYLNLDDVSVLAPPTEPLIIASPDSLHFFAMVDASATATVDVLGYNIAAGITATTDAPFTLSADGDEFSGTVTLDGEGGTLYVQFSPSEVGHEEATITISGTGAESVTISLSGDAMVAATLPYSQSFEDTDEEENINWGFQHNGVNQWVIGTAVNNTEEGSQALYISNDNGVSNAYTINSPSTSWAYRDIDFGEYLEYQLAFDFKGVGESSSYDYLKIYLGPPAEMDYEGAYTGATPAGAQLLGTLANVSTWTHYTATLTSHFHGLQRLYLLWWNDGSAGSNPPAALDNISIVGTNCARPAAAVVDSVTATEVFAHFIPASSDDNSWEYALCTGSEMADSVVPVPLNDTVFYIEDLTPATTYRIYIRTACENDEFSAWSNVSTFATECVVVEVTDENPFVETFDGLTSGIPLCWDNTEGTTTTSSYRWNYYATGEIGHGLRFNSYSNTNGNTNMLKTPVLDLSQVTDPQLSFSYKNPDGGDFSVFVSTDGGLTYTTSVATGLTNMSNWSSVSYPLENLTENNNVVIVFKGTSNYGSDDAYIYLDNVVVGATPSCPAPTNLVATSTATDTVLLSWTDAEGELWDIIYGPSGFDIQDDGDSIVTINGVTEHTYAVPGLTGGVTYDFYVRRDCGSGDYSPWSTIPASAAPYTIAMGIQGSRTVTGCGFTITDNGGPNGEYANSCNYTLTILPPDANTVISVSGVVTCESNWDYLKIYDGTSVTGGTLLDDLSSSTQISFGPFTSETGAITLKFTSDGSGTYAGFVINASCLPAPTCRKPSGLAISELGVTTATITWPANENAEGYNVAISTQANFNPDTCSELLNTDANEYEFLDLSGNTNYYVRIQMNCGGEDLSDWSNAITFLTLAGLPAEIPYFCDFSDEEENSAWTLVNGTMTNKWYIGEHGTATDTALFVSNNGTDEAYSHSTTNVWAYRDIQFGEGAEFNIDITWKALAESCCDYLKVYIGSPAAVTAGSSTAPTGAVALSGNLNASSSYQHFTTVLNSNYANTTQRLYLLWHNDGSGGSNPPAVVDEIRIDATSCGRPYTPSVASISSDNVNIVFHPALLTDENWEYALCTGSETVDSVLYEAITDTSFVIEDLTPATTYRLYVRTVCGDDETSTWSNVCTFTTNCMTVVVTNSAPFVEDFNNLTSGIPTCWDNSEGTVSTASYRWNYYTTGQTGACLRFNSYVASSGQVNMLKTPIMDLSQVTDPQLSFSYKNPTGGDFSVYLSTNGGHTYTTPIATGLIGATAWTEVTYSLENLTEDEDVVIVFKGTSNYGNGDAYIYLDNVKVGKAPSCPSPVKDSVRISAVGAHTATVSFVDHNETHNSWTVYYRKHNNTQGEWLFEVVNDSTVATLNGLDPETRYDVYVITNCEEPDEFADATYTVSFVTLVACPVPTGIHIVSVTSSQVEIGWEGDAEGYIVECSEGTVDVTGNTATITGLESSTTYTANIIADCGDEGTSDTVLVTFRTEMPATNLPYSTDFTDATNQEWYLNNGTLTNHWIMGTINDEGALFVTNSTTPATATATYSVSSAATVMAEKLFNMPANDSVHVEFDLKVGGEGDTYVYDYVKVFLAPANAVFTAGTSQNAYSYYDSSRYAMNFSEYASQLGAPTHPYSACLSEGTIHISQDMPVPANSSTAKIVFLWRNDTSLGDGNSAVISNFSITTVGPAPVVTVPSVTTVDADPVGQTTATLNATITNPDDVAITAKGFQWKVNGGDYQNVTGSGSGNTFVANLTNLTASTQYFFKAYITTADTTVYGAELSFTTLPEDVDPCATPTGVTTSNITKESITVSWDNVEGVTWHVQYRQVNGTFASADASTNSYVITGLIPETTYEIQVQADCGNGNVSAWSEMVTATTLPDAVNNYLENSVVLYPNPAKEVINVQCTMNEWNGATIEVLDVYGKLLQTLKADSEITQINVSNLANGMYFVRMTTEQGVVTKRFVKK